MLCAQLNRARLLGFNLKMETEMTLQELIKEKRPVIRKIAAKHGAKNIRIFGSVVRGESSQESDIDFLVDAGPETSSWFPAGLILDLEEILGCRVEVVTERGLNPHLREHVLRGPRRSPFPPAPRGANRWR